MIQSIAFYKNIFFLLFVFLLPTACGKKEFPKAVPKQVFEKLEDAIRAHYLINPEGRDSNMAADFRSNYKAALKTIAKEVLPNTADYYKARLFDLLGQKPVSYERLRSPLEAFVEALPIGENRIYFLTSRSQKRYSIGVVLRKHSAGFLVVDVLEGSGAFRANLHPGLVITRAGGRALQALGLPQAVSLIRGPKNTFVKLEFQSGNSRMVERAPFSFRPVQSARWQSLRKNNILYLMPRSANSIANGRIRSLLQRQGRTDVLILDLRKLFDGSLQGAFELADFFLPAKERILLKKRNVEGFVLTSSAEQIFSGKLYVITNRYASGLSLLIAFLLQNRSATFAIGPEQPAKVFLQDEIKIAPGIILSLTSGSAFGADGIPLYEKRLRPDFVMQTGFPKNPPLSGPDPADPPQVLLAKLIGLPLD